jgi:hypothetical protein
MLVLAEADSLHAARLRGRGLRLLVIRPDATLLENSNPESGLTLGAGDGG